MGLLFLLIINALSAKTNCFLMCRGLVEDNTGKIFKIGVNFSKPDRLLTHNCPKSNAP